MAEFEIKCPHCGGSLEVQDEWVDMETSCPVCGKAFVIPQRPTAAKHPPVLKLPKAARKPAAQNGGAAAAAPDIILTDKELQALKGEDDSGKKANILLWVKWSIRIALLIAIVIGGCLIYKKLTAPTPKSLKGNQLYLTATNDNHKCQRRQLAETIKRMILTEAFLKPKNDFFYRDAKFKDLYLGPAKIDGNQEEFDGTVTFVRKVGGKEKLMERPVKIVRQNNVTITITFPFIYANHPDYLEEDGDLLLAQAQQIDSRLPGYEYISGKAEGDGVLICTVSKSGVERQLKLKASQVDMNDGILRIWVEVLSMK